MKWIGQHIWDFISRFRSDVYLESTEAGTIVSGGNLGLDSNNKIVKADTNAGELSITNAGDNRVVTSSGGTDLNAESSFSYNSGGVLGVTSALGPSLSLYNTGTTSAVHSIINFVRTDTTGADGHELGLINFWGYDEGGGVHFYAQIESSIVDASPGAEEGQLTISVASHDGELQPGLIVNSGDAEDKVNVTIANGAASVTTIAGTLTMGSTAAMGNTGLLTVGAQTGITAAANLVTVGTIGTGVWNGTVVANAYLDADTAHLTTDQTFTGVKQINSRKFTKTADGTHFEYQGDVLYFGGGSTTQGDLCYLKEDGEWGQADADGAATGDDADRDAMGMLAIALGTDPDVDGMFIKGTITMDYDLGDVGNPVYISTTAGDMSNAVPGSGDFVRVVGYCLDDTHGQMYFNPDNTWVEVA